MPTSNEAHQTHQTHSSNANDGFRFALPVLPGPSALGRVTGYHRSALHNQRIHRTPSAGQGDEGVDLYAVELS